MSKLNHRLEFRALIKSDSRELSQRRAQGLRRAYSRQHWSEDPRPPARQPPSPITHQQTPMILAGPRLAEQLASSWRIANSWAPALNCNVK
nr:hypothetical protein CFP56_23809 [Quercus suber]